MLNKIKRELLVIFSQVGSTPSAFKLALFFAFAFLLIFAALGNFIKKGGEKVPPPQTAAFERNERPEDYFNPFGKLPEPETIIKIIEPEQPPPPPKPRIDPSRAFAPIERDLTPSAAFLKRQEIQEKRKKSFGIGYIPREAVGDSIIRKKVWDDRSADKDYSAQKLQKSVPSYPVDLSRVLTVDSVIPAILYTEINSEVSSAKVIAQIDQNIYASQGRAILIPRGSRAIGSYEPLEEVGEERLAMTWNRIITPDGISIILDAEVMDAYGQAGLTGKVDQRYAQKYGGALFFAGISALAQLTVSADNEAQASAADALTDQLGAVTADAIQDNIDIAPRITIPRGTRINLSSLSDIWFKPPQNERIDVVPLSELEFLDTKYTLPEKPTSNDFSYVLDDSETPRITPLPAPRNYYKK